ncbi:MAG: rubredoxin [Rhodocyclales bacterium RIFCSPLOWO2_02_FULL_63_24]|nr:MAG: rubredoxin [Rhodocyclales bacterium RIFCSPLOWO2_02_FULL_63_24]
MNAYQCGACYFPYEEDLGLPDQGLAAGTKWEDVPEDFICPECGTPKAGFINWIKDAE